MKKFFNNRNNEAPRDHARGIFERFGEISPKHIPATGGDSRSLLGQWRSLELSAEADNSNSH